MTRAVGAETRAHFMLMVGVGGHISPVSMEVYSVSVRAGYQRRNSMNFTEIIRRVEYERSKQNLKWGSEFFGRPDQHWVAIVMEELGEAVAEILHTSPSETGSMDSNSLAQLFLSQDRVLETELIQTIATLFSWLEHRTPFSEQVRIA